MLTDCEGRKTKPYQQQALLLPIYFLVCNHNPSSYSIIKYKKLTNSSVSTTQSLKVKINFLVNYLKAAEVTVYIFKGLNRIS